MSSTGSSGADCAARTARFNQSWFDPEKLPNTWRLELAFYVISMTLLFTSMAVRLIASRVYPSDWLRARSNTLMIMCHMGALVQFQTSGLAKSIGSQTQCWFQVLGSLLIVPLCLIPPVVKLIWFMSSSAFNEAVRVGVHQIVSLEALEEQEFTKLRENFMMGRLAVGRASQIYASNMDEAAQRKMKTLRRLQRWRFWSSSRGVAIVFVVILLPFIIIAFSTFAYTDDIFLTTCTGCVLNLFIHNLFIILFAVLSILMVSFFIWRVRKSSDPFGHVREVKQAVYSGALLALIGFILNVAVPAEKWCDGWSWNILVATGLLIFSVIQGGYQVYVARFHHSADDAEDREPLQASQSRQNSIVDPSSNLSELLQLVFTKKPFHDAFEQYLCTEFAVESLAFLDAVNDFKNGYFDRGTLASTVLARRIVRTFVQDNSTLTINVSATQRQELLNRVEGLRDGDIVSFDAFDECYLEVFKMVQLGPLVRFTNSPQYEELKNAGIFDSAMVPANKVGPLA